MAAFELSLSRNVSGITTTASAQTAMLKRDMAALDRGLFRCAHLILDRSQPLVPVSTEETSPGADHGALKRSGRVERNEHAGGYDVVYGGRDYGVDYAFFVHENMPHDQQRVHHNPPGAIPRWLAVATRITTGERLSILARVLDYERRGPITERGFERTGVTTADVEAEAVPFGEFTGDLKGLRE